MAQQNGLGADSLGRIRQNIDRVSREKVDLMDSLLNFREEPQLPQLPQLPQPQILASELLPYEEFVRRTQQPQTPVQLPSLNLPPPPAPVRTRRTPVARRLEMEEENQEELDNRYQPTTTPYVSGLSIPDQEETEALNRAIQLSLQPAIVDLTSTTTTTTTTTATVGEKRKAETEYEVETCVACMVKKPEVQFVKNCQHKVVCYDCFIRLPHAKCPICRARVKHYSWNRDQ